MRPLPMNPCGDRSLGLLMMSALVFPRARLSRQILA
jgi:hypothetical protein